MMQILRITNISMRREQLHNFLMITLYGVKVKTNNE